MEERYKEKFTVSLIRRQRARCNYMKDSSPLPRRKTQHTMNSWTISKAQTKDHLEWSGENQCMVRGYSATKDRSWYYTDLHSSQNTMTE